MILSKKEQDVLNIIRMNFHDWNFDDDIFSNDVEYFNGNYESYYQSTIEITKTYINAKICLNDIEMDRFLEIHYDKTTKKLYSYHYYMHVKKISFKKIKELLQGELE